MDRWAQERGRVGYTAEKVAENFAKQSAKETFSSGWDMVNAVEIIGKLVSRGARVW